MNQNTPSPNGFVGGYVNDMVNVLAAALIGRQNAVLIGAPGYGKTRVALSFAHQVVGKDATSVTRLDAAAMSLSRLQSYSGGRPDPRSPMFANERGRAIPTVYSNG